MIKGFCLFCLFSIVICWLISSILISIIYKKFNNLLVEMAKYDSCDNERILQWQKACDVISTELEYTESNMMTNILFPIANIFFVIGLIILAYNFISAMNIMKKDVEQLNLNSKTLSFLATFILAKMPKEMEEEKIEDFTREYILNNMEEDDELKSIVDIENKRDLFDKFVKEISYHVKKIRTACQGKN